MSWSCASSFPSERRYELSDVVVTGPAQRLVEEAVQRFVGEDTGRSVAVESLRGVPVSVAVAADVSRPAASLLKVPLVSAVYAAGGLESTVTRSELGSTLFATVLAAFADDHRFSVRELCSLCLVTSDNLVAEYLLERVGIDAVNREAERLAGPGTRLEVGFGDAYLSRNGLVNVTTARESLRMMRILVGDQAYAEIVAALRNSIRNARIPLRLPNVRVAAKSGTLVGVVNDVGVLFGEETDLAVAFLSEEQPDREATGLEIGECVAEIWQAIGDTRGHVRRF
jgi:beta-lactamase class A